VDPREAQRPQGRRRARGRVTSHSLKSLRAEVGELLERHDRGRSLAEFREYREDPVGFIREELEGEPWEAQVEVAESFRDNPLTVVRSANGIGKDWTAARLALWWAYARKGLVVLTGPTLRQVKSILMGEVRSAWARARGLPGELFELALRLNRSEPSGILAFTSSEASKKTGFHAPALAVIITEAQGVEDDTYEAALANATGEESRILALGNPLSRATRFYRLFEYDGAWERFKIPAQEHPNVREGREIIPGAVTRSFIDRMATEYGETSGIYGSRVLAEFPSEDAEEVLVRWAWLEAAAERWSAGEFGSVPEDVGPVVAVDPARFGADSSVAAVRLGPVLRDFFQWRGKDTMRSAGEVTKLVARLRADGFESVTVVVDESGLGGGVLDRLRENFREDGAVRFRGFQGGSGPEERDRFQNARAESFWRLRRLLEDGLVALPDDPDLFEELAETRWEVTAQGRIQLEPKEALKSRIGRSPDKGDAAAMAFSVEPEVPFAFVFGEEEPPPEGMMSGPGDPGWNLEETGRRWIRLHRWGQ